MGFLFKKPAKKAVVAKPAAKPVAKKAAVKKPAAKPASQILRTDLNVLP